MCWAVWWWGQLVLPWQVTYWLLRLFVFLILLNLCGSCFYWVSITLKILCLQATFSFAVILAQTAFFSHYVGTYPGSLPASIKISLCVALLAFSFLCCSCIHLRSLPDPDLALYSLFSCFPPAFVPCLFWKVYRCNDYPPLEAGSATTLTLALLKILV
jgi:hypothetical protein